MPPRPTPPRDPSQRPASQSHARTLAVRLRLLLGRYRVGSVPVPAKAPLPGDAGSRPLKLARAILWWEALWPPLWRPLSLLGLFLAVAWMGLFVHLSPWLHVPLLLTALGGVGYLVRQGLRSLRLPTEADARRRLERDSRLAHRPLSQLQDGIAGGAGDPLAHALWRLAQERAKGQARDLRVDLPDSRLANRDPWALRVAVALLMVVGATVGWGDLGGRTLSAFVPSMGLGGVFTPTRLDAWATPPDYTGQPPVFLTGLKPPDAQDEEGQEKPLFLPAGTKLVVRLDGGLGTPTLRANNQDVDFQPVAGGGHQVELALTEGEGVSVRQFGREVASWPVRLVPDQPPGIAFRTPPSATERNALRIDYTGADDYGIHAVTATVTLATDLPLGIDKTPLDLALPVPAKNKREITGTGYHDLSGHPWAGMPVTVRLRATDGAGQVSQSAEQAITLPERHFNHPVARAIIEQRKTLILMGDTVRPLVGRALHDLSVNLDGYNGDPLAFLALRSAVGRLMRNAGPDTVPSSIAMLWDVALRIEDGNLSLAERELRDAQKALMEALDRNAPAEEIDQAMQRLEQAMRDFMDALEQQEAKNPQAQDQPQNQGEPDPNAQSMTRDEVEDMVRQMRDLAASGNHEAAREMLSQLQQMMENLQNGQPQQQQDAEANQQGQALAELNQKLRDVQKQQQQLMDETFTQQQEQFDGAEELPPNQLPGLSMPNRQGRRPGDQGAQRGKADAHAGAMAGKQEELRGELGEIMRRLGEVGGEIPRPLGRAERAMKDAADALRSGAPDQAVASQGEALEQLQQTLKSMQEQMAKASPGQAGGQRNRSGRQQGRDPLGRPLPGSGTLDGEEVKIPAEADMQRARQILEELRRRAGEQNRPKAERDYIDRLLDRFKRY